MTMFGDHTQQEVEKYIAEQAGVESVSLVAFDPVIHGEVPMAKFGLACFALLFSSPDKEGLQACLVPLGAGLGERD